MKISEIMSTLERLGASPRKSLGQNFLHDKNIADWIVAQLDLRSGEHVVEIGPGLGALSVRVLESGLSATLLEKDKLFAAYLQERLPVAQVKIVSGDALEYDPREFFANRPAKLLGALPYYISTPLIFHYTAEPCPFSCIVLVLQREVAERLVAQPGTKAYGSLSLVIQARWEVRLLRVLPRSIFLPAPQVDSAAILLTPRPPGSVPATDWPFFRLLVKTGFSERRKQLTNLLDRVVENHGAVPEALTKAGAEWNARAEELSLFQWIEFTNLLRPQPSGTEESDEQLDVVDAADRVIERSARKTVHEQAMRHRAAHVFVFNGHGELLLQHRSVRKSQYPGRWDSSASGHVESGEDYLHCAVRELKEELGLTLVEPRLLAKLPASERTGHEFIWLFEIWSDAPLTYNPLEIQEVGFFPLSIIDRWIARTPGDFAPGFLEAYRKAR